ncbi:MAG: hypothetical protein J1F02_10650 [Lachnospiraceae bacterium]|nr:hypothetical protein [Lachnospiraceae bacterium]
MKVFVQLYGKGILGVLALAFMVTAGCYWFGKEWGRYGVAEDGAKADFSVEPVSQERPDILALNRRVLQREKILVKELASVVDEKGQDFSEYLHFYNEDGKELTGYFSTEHPGIYPMVAELSVPDVGWYSKKKFTILVDGRILT